MDTCCKTSKKNTKHRSLKQLAILPFLLLIRFYQICLSPFLGPCCRFEPSCSHYAYQSLTQHGLIKGFFLASKRIAKCHPWHPGGFDPVPPKQSEKTS